MNTDRPLSGLASLKVKLGLLVVASTMAVLVVAAIGRRAGVPTLVSGPVTIAAALAVTHWLARGMTAPLREMTMAARRMAAGDWSERITVTSRDEVGELAQSFNAMATDLATHDAQRRALIATVSHELRTPLAAQRALLENLADGVVAPDERTLGTALAQAERLSDLVRDLLDLSRIQGGAADLDLGEVDVGAFLASCVAEAELRSRDVTHEVAVEPPGLTVRADAARLAQVVMNLVDNADRHSPPGGTVRLVAAADGDQWTLDVHDEGPGIPAEQRHRLFERFGSANPTTGGSGLGLAIARWICELHAGRIDVIDSDIGARVRVRLPITPTPPTPPPAPSGPATTPAAPPNPAARHTEEKSMTTTPATPAASVPLVPATPPASPVGDIWASIWPERDRSPQVRLTGLAAGVGLVAAALLPLARGMGLAVTIVLALGGSLAFVAGRAWRSPWALGVWGLCLVGAVLLTIRTDPGLTILGLLLAVPLFMSAFTGARTILGLGLSAMFWILAAVRGLPLLGRTLGALRLRRNIWSVLRAVAVTIVGVVVFGALFASADAIVQSWFSRLVPDWRWDEVTVRVFLWVFVTGLVLTAIYVAINPPHVEPSTRPARRPVRQRFEWLLPTGAVIALFVTFLAAQASALFGGDAHVLRTAGLTYAEYARQGFGYLCVVTALTAGVLALIRFVAPEATASDRSVKRGASGLLVGLALLVVASALHRMWLYQGAYGFTTTRISAILAELWLALVLLLAGAAALGWSWRYAARAALVAAVTLLLGQSAVNVDARVVELNAARYAETGRIDVHYLQSLAGDGAGAIRASFPAEIAACALTAPRWSAQERHWAGWNLGVESLADARAGLDPAMSSDCALALSSPSDPTPR